MSMRFAADRRTICEVIREINDLVQGTDSTSYIIRDRLAEAEHMAKRMSAKLREYNQDYDRDWWEANPDYNSDLIRAEHTYHVGRDPGST